MKKSLKSQPEPPCLERYRTLNPQASWDQFRDDSDACYKTLRVQCRTDQRGLCAYCEISLTPENEQIAHFHPKSDTSTAHNWALDWDNLWLACKGGTQSWMNNEENYREPLPENRSCDESTEARVLDGVTLSPAEVPPFPRIFRFEQRPDALEIHPDESHCTEAGLSKDKVARTITEYNLNCGRLSEARLRVYRPIEQIMRQVREKNVNSPAALMRLAQIHLGPSADGRWGKFFTLVRWRLGKIAEDYLASISYAG